MHQARLEDAINLLNPARETDLKEGICTSCKDVFSSSNTHTEAGWKETSISGMCEDCWDNLFSEED